MGRPSFDESELRTRELLRRVAAGDSLLDAARAARVKPERVLRLLDEPEFFAAVVALLRGRACLAA